MKKLLIIILSVAASMCSYGQAQQTVSKSLWLMGIQAADSSLFASQNGRIWYGPNGIRYTENGEKKSLKAFATSTYTGTSPTTVTVGGLAAGTNISGQTLQSIIQSIVAPYVNPVFTSFSVTGQATTVEVGTTLSGSKTFTWAITVNSGVVPTIDIRDVTASNTLLAGTPNDGSQPVTVTTIQLNSNGSTQVWRGIGNNTSPAGTFNSSDFTVTGRFFRFFGPVSASPTNSAQVRAISSGTFHTGAATFNLLTGTTLTKFVCALPPGVTISQVIDLDALNANITSQYILTGTINVLDAGGTNRAYNIYEMNVGSPYSTSHRHAITTAN